MGTLCFTVDFDRDSNVPVAGRRQAGSMSAGRVGPPRFAASSEGAAILVEMLDGLGIPGTFFSEAETLASSRDADLGGHEVALHGLAHEDMAGSPDGGPMPEGEVERTVAEACGIVADIVGSRPRGFRAPYMKPPDCLPGVLSRLGFEYDSSRYSGDGFPIPGDGIICIPALRVPDGKGGTITSYLWPMHEGKRDPPDFRVLHDAAGEGTLVLATHTWHMCATADGRAFGAGEREANLRRTLEVLEAALDAGFRAKKCIDVATTARRSRGPARDAHQINTYRG